MLSCTVMSAVIFAVAADPPAVVVHTGHAAKAGRTTDTTFHLFADLPAFEASFGTLPTVGQRKPNPVTTATFDTRRVAAVVTRGKAVVVFTEVSAKADGDTLTVSYKTQTGTPGAVDLACPLVVSVPKGTAKVVFVQNGKEVGSAR